MAGRPASWLLEDACGRAEKAGKDEDLIVALRAVWMLWREKIREEDRERH